MRVLLAIAMAVGALQCQRMPREEFARSADSHAVADAPPKRGPPDIDWPPAGRCVQRTPPEPPGLPTANPAIGCPADPEVSPTRLPRVRVAFPESSTVAVSAELVKSQHDTMRGLMYRRNLAEDDGMLFDLRERDDHKFWMHNTCISLDMMFVDDDGLIVGIVENAPVLNDESRSVGCPSRWVLEVNAGWSRRHGVKAGRRAVWDLPSTP
jgi:uncharacterized membrane protein (UPF0127 family)